MKRETLIAVIGAVVVAVLVLFAIEARHKGPLEKAGESLDKAADDLGDAAKDATN